MSGDGKFTFMKTIFYLTLQSLRFRKTTVSLTIATIAISVLLILGVHRLRVDTKQSFQKTISNVDLIVGAKTGSTQLLLSTVFHHGFPSNNISYNYFQTISQRQDVDFAIPISLGDSHRGHRVIGTNGDFFQHFSYGNKQALTFAQGKDFVEMSNVVLGHTVAKKFNYAIGDPIVISHGIAEISFLEHDQVDFRVTGILEPTGTPVDRALYISLEAMEAIHQDEPGDLTPTSITAIFLSLSNKASIFSLQRSINEYNREPLLAIIPALTLFELWALISVAEKALLAVSVLVFLAGMIGLLTSILISMRERIGEMAILRSQGASPVQIASLFTVESVLVTGLGVLAGLLLLQTVLWSLRGYFATTLGIYFEPRFLDSTETIMVAGFCGFGLIIGLIPSILAYRKTLHQGLKQ